MAKLKLDLHEVFNKNQKIEDALNEIINEAIEKKIELVEIIPGKGSGQLKKRVLRFLDQNISNNFTTVLIKTAKTSGIYL